MLQGSAQRLSGLLLVQLVQRGTAANPPANAGAWKVVGGAGVQRCAVQSCVQPASRGQACRQACSK